VNVGARPLGGRPLGGRPLGGRPLGGRPLGGRRPAPLFAPLPRLIDSSFRVLLLATPVAEQRRVQLFVFGVVDGVNGIYLSLKLLLGVPSARAIRAVLV